MAFLGGQHVGRFEGAQPESQVRQFVERLVGAGGVGESPIDQALEQAAQMVEAGDLQTAAQVYVAILKEEATNPDALAGLAEVYLATGDLEQAANTLAIVPPEHANKPAVLSAKAKLELAGTPVDTGAIDALRAKVEANADDHEARFELAQALNGARDPEGAIDHLLEIIRRKRDWNEDAARQQLLTIFEALGPTHELTTAGRRKLSSILFS